MNIPIQPTGSSVARQDAESGEIRPDISRCCRPMKKPLGESDTIIREDYATTHAKEES